jgi:hypothetical protein
MEQLLCHLVGDFVLQTNWMVHHKINRITVAAIHALFYILPFFLITQSPLCLFIIFTTHVFIDRFRLAREVIRFRNWSWNENGFPAETPPYLVHGITIVVDNTIHLAINFFAIKYLG